MEKEKKKIKMENRAWMGIRLVTEPIVLTKYNRGLPLGTHTKHVYTIERHIPLNHFMLELEFSIAEMFHSNVSVFSKKIEGCYGKLIGFSKTIKPLIKKIEDLENVQVIVTDEKLEVNEAYEISENEKTLLKIPSWRTPIKKTELIIT